VEPFAETTESGFSGAAWAGSTIMTPVGWYWWGRPERRTKQQRKS
jgi:hypothetical protein